MENKTMVRRKSYTAKFKLEAVDYAKKNGNRAAARRFHVGEASIREWRKAELTLKSGNKMKRAVRYRKCFWPGVEKKLIEWVVLERSKGHRISISGVLMKAKVFAEEEKIVNFNPYPSWASKFMKRHNMCFRSSSGGFLKALGAVLDKRTPKYEEEEEGASESAVSDMPDDVIVRRLLDSFNVESEEEFDGFE